MPTNIRTALVRMLAPLVSILALNSAAIAQRPADSATMTVVLTGSAAPRLFAPGVVASMSNQWNATFTPDARTVYFSRGTFWTIMLSHKTGSGWSEPEVAPFSGKWMDTDPFVSPDGRRVYFVSNRPLNGDSAAAPAAAPATDYSIWYVERLASGAWSAPTSAGNVINGHGSVWFPCVTSDGTLYFHTRGRSDAIGGSDIYAARWVVDHFAEPAPISIDTKLDDQEPYVAPDQSYIIFVSNRPGNLGSNDLYISVRRNGAWQSPMHLAAPVNSYAMDMAPSVSPDGHTLYFTTARRTYHGVRPARVDAAGLMKELNSTDNGSLQIYEIPLDANALKHQITGD